MSVFTTLAATPSRIGIAARTILRTGQGGIERAALVSLLTPRSLGPGDDRESAIGDDVITAMVELGLLVASPPGRVVPTDVLRVWDRLDVVPVLESRLLATDTISTDFAKCLAWFMLQDPGRPFEWNGDPRLRDETTTPVDLRATARFQNFVYWSQALGYVWRVEAGERTFVVPDPTAALTRRLRELLSDNSTPIATFMDRVSATFSVLDGGAANREVAPEDTEASASVSRALTVALLRLERRGVFSLEHRSDAAAWLLQSWPEPRAVTHISERT